MNIPTALQKMRHFRFSCPLFKAETEEKLEKIRDLEVPEMEQAINVIKKEGIVHVSNGQCPRYICFEFFPYVFPLPLNTSL